MVHRKILLRIFHSNHVHLRQLPPSSISDGCSIMCRLTHDVVLGVQNACRNVNTSLRFARWSLARSGTIISTKFCVFLPISTPCHEAEASLRKSKISTVAYATWRLLARFTATLGERSFMCTFEKKSLLLHKCPSALAVFHPPWRVQHRHSMWRTRQFIFLDE